MIFRLLNRRCWWCGGKLSAASHAVLPDGRWTHKICEKDALASFKPLTAQPAEKAIPSEFEPEEVPFQYRRR